MMNNNDGRIFDPQMALEQASGDQEVLKEIVDIHCQEYPKQLHEIQESIDKNDAATVKQVAHTIKGAVSNFGAKPAFEAALRLERIGKSGDLSEVESAFTALKTELERLEQELKKIQPSV